MLRRTLFIVWIFTGACEASASPPTAAMLRDLPVTFERNQGQWPRGVEFGAHITGHRYTFSEDGITIDGSVRLELARPAHGKLEGFDRVGTKTNYLAGHDPHAWITGVPNYRRIRRRSAFPGIDIIFYGSHGQLEFDYVVAPGANPAQIHLRVRGARLESVSGGLKLITVSGDVLHLQAPAAYQDTAAGRRVVDCELKLDNSGEVSFAATNFDRAAPLLIDPVLTYLAVLTENSLPTFPNASVTDAAGAFYIAGLGLIPATAGTLRTTTSCKPIAFCGDAWVIKLNAADHQVAWATYFPSSGSATMRSIGLDPASDVVIGGEPGPVFPVTPDAYLSTPPPAGGGFLAKLNPTGSALLYATFLDQPPVFMKIDSTGAVYFSGGPAVEKLSADGSTILYSTPTPGGVAQIAVGDTGALYAVSGPSAQLAVTPGAYKSSDADGLYILKLDPHGSPEFVASFNPMPAFVTNGALPSDIGLDSVGNIVFTSPAAAGIPAVNDPDPQPNDCGSQPPCMAYVAALDPTGSTLLYSRLLGHGQGERLAFGPSGEVYVAGQAYGVDFPRTWDAFQFCSNPIGEPNTTPTLPYFRVENGFVMRLGSQGQREFSSFLGTNSTSIEHLRLAADGTLYLGGYTLSEVPVGSSGGEQGFFSAVIDTNHAPPIPHACLVNATQSIPDFTFPAFSGTNNYIWVAPGQMVTLFGEGLGPQAPAYAEWNADGSLSNSLAGVQVLFDGTAAPILYAQANQVNCIVPFAVGDNATTSIVVQYAGTQTDPLVFHVAPSVPDPFTNGNFPGADLIAINEDGTLNSADHPASDGSVITLFVTGLGQTSPPLQDGTIAPGAAQATSGIGVSFLNSQGNSWVSGQVLYQGAAPGELAGVYQVNVRIPASTSTGHTQVQFGVVGGGVYTAAESIWLQ